MSKEKNSPEAAALPLIGAVRAGDAQGLRDLIAAGAGLEERQEDGMTALHAAVVYGKAWAIPLLLAAGADIEARDSGGNTSLIWAARENLIDISLALVDAGADLHARDGGGYKGYLDSSTLWMDTRHLPPGGNTPAEWARLMRHDVLAELLHFRMATEGFRKGIPQDMPAPPPLLPAKRKCSPLR